MGENEADGGVKGKDRRKETDGRGDREREDRRSESE
jgi:hypothetical protein